MNPGSGQNALTGATIEGVDAWGKRFVGSVELGTLFVGGGMNSIVRSPGRDAALNKTIRELSFQPSSGTALRATPGKTTTILGNYSQDMKHIINELGNVKSTNFGPRSGDFNVLNVPDNLYITPSQFWAEYNQPWLNNAIIRKDAILMATEPQFGPDSMLFRLNRATGKYELSGFGREYLYLRQNGFKYDPINKRMTGSP